MAATVEKLENSKVKLSFTASAETFDKAMHEAYKNNAKKFRVPKFRPGKAPFGVAIAYYGEASLFEDAIDIVFSQEFYPAIIENKLDVVSRPDNLDVQEIGMGKELKFSVEVTVMPEVKLGEYKGVEAEKKVTEVTEDDVKADIERARDNASRLVDITDRAVKLDDQITLDYEGKIDGVAFEGGTAKDYKLTIGSGSFIPGFEDQLVGFSIGETKDVNVTFPEEYHQKELAGKPAVFTCTVKSIQEKELPELDDEFAKDVSEFDTFEEYKASVKEKLEKNAKEADDKAFEQAVIEAVCAKCEVEVPEVMVDNEVDNQIERVVQQFSMYGMKKDDIFNMMGGEEDYRKNIRPAAKERVTMELILNAITTDAGITAEEDELNKKMDETAAQMSADPEKFKTENADRLKTYCTDIVVREKTVAMLVANAVAKA